MKKKRKTLESVARTRHGNVKMRIFFSTCIVHQKIVLADEKSRLSQILKPPSPKIPLVRTNSKIYRKRQSALHEKSISIGMKI